MADMAKYEPIERGALCRPFRVYVICVPPPPSSGVALLQLMEMSEYAPDLAWGPDNAAAWVVFAQLQRLMYADRDRYVGDPAFVGVPVEGLLDEDYTASRAELASGLTGAATAGTPPGGVFRDGDATREPGGTSHMVIIDAEGNAVSMTTTVESIFGPARMVGGFFLNNQLTDFSFTPTRSDGADAANAVAAGKRPRSSMSPLIIMDQQGNLVGAMGSPGGSSILAYNAKGLIGTLIWGLPVQRAFDLLSWPRAMALARIPSASRRRCAKAWTLPASISSRTPRKTPAFTALCGAVRPTEPGVGMAAPTTGARVRRGRTDAPATSCSA